MNNNKSNERRIIFDYIGHHPEYGKHKCVCHVCGTECDISGKVIFEGDQGGIWNGEHFEFPVCATCFYETLAKSMTNMDSAIMQREITREKEREKYCEEYEPFC